MIQVVIKSEISQTDWDSSENQHYYVIDGVRLQPVGRISHWQPFTDVYETKDSVTVRVEIAGMVEEDFSIALRGRLLSITGERRERGGRRAYHRMEIPFGAFALDIELPAAVDEIKAQASYENGFLLIVLPKARPHQIRIEE